MIVNTPVLTNTVFGIVLVVTLIFGLHPKDFSLHAKPAIDQRGYVSFAPYSIATTSLDLSGTHTTVDGLADLKFTIALTIPTVPDNGSLFTVLFSIHDSSGYNQMLLGQWQSTFIVMSGADYRNLTNMPRITASLDSIDGYVYPEEVQVNIEATSSKTSVSINDQLIAHDKNYAPVWKPDVYTVSLGNTPNRKQSWSGSLSAFSLQASNCIPSSLEPEDAVCNPIQTRSLNGLLQSAFVSDNSSPQIPNTDKSPTWHLEPPLSLLRSEWLSSKALIDITSPVFHKDVLINFLGFIPLSLFTFIFMSARYQPTAATVLTVVMATSVSLLIESIQIYIPSRTSSLVDLVVNSSASVISVICCLATLSWIRYRSKASSTA